MRASLRAEYGLDLRGVLEARTMSVSDLVDLVIWLPRGCAFWKSVGGPAAVSDVEVAVRHLDYSVRVFDFHQRGGKGRVPQEPQMPPLASDRQKVAAKVDVAAQAWLARQRLSD